MIPRCEFGHLLDEGWSTDTTLCPACIKRRARARLRLGIPPDGPLPAAPVGCYAKLEETGEEEEAAA